MWRGNGPKSRDRVAWARTKRALMVNISPYHVITHAALRKRQLVRAGHGNNRYATALVTAIDAIMKHYQWPQALWEPSPNNPDALVDWFRFDQPTGIISGTLNLVVAANEIPVELTIGIASTARINEWVLVNGRQNPIGNIIIDEHGNIGMNDTVSSALMSYIGSTVVDSFQRRT